eukprot:2887908-Rhodomonas_salina.4
MRTAQPLSAPPAPATQDHKPHPSYTLKGGGWLLAFDFGTHRVRVRSRDLVLRRGEEAVDPLRRLVAPPPASVLRTPQYCTRLSTAHAAATHARLLSAEHRVERA